jgi:dTDP-glucose 4,6-dehydratase
MENFESGLRKTVLWYLNNANWWQPLRSRVYSGQRLGLVDKTQANAGQS